MAVRADTGGRWSCAFAGLSVELSAGAQKVASQQEAAGLEAYFGIKPSKLPPAAYQAGRRAGEQTDGQADRQIDGQTVHHMH